ncbi:HNH/endonuclease VII fold putative polymorphic toxin [Spongiimicrobium sp. 2-473A-2-J]|uniref:HNH/endonuclease VII fold putative polymorphic toxin n=1 Tax=Eudoraea algarum TaxID=3417568 RepID=UPI003D35E46B
MYLKLAPDPCHPPLQLVDYSYNTRGWLTSINDVNNIASDLFSFRLGYNEGSDPLYNGNIAKSEWKTANTDQSLRDYAYTYDALNRITTAIDNTGNYSLGSATNPVTYDKNGNIGLLLRKGHTNAAATSFGIMDDLVYTYDNNSNKLKKVADAAPIDAFGFKDDAVNTAADTVDDYTYDANGNMLTDANKGITSITYNHLNLPTQVTLGSGNIQYIYDATGVKQKKVVNETGLSSVTTEYAGDYVYENSSLKQFNHLEGYIEPNGSNYQYVYQLKDIWGNTRITYSDDNGDGSVTSSEIRREQNYYPFGLEHQGYNGASYGVKNNLKTYQGQEFTEDLDLNTHEWRYRVSDPATGRFWQIDPLAEDYSYNSTYAFQENKLGIGVELEGLEVGGFLNPADIFNFRDGKGKPVLTFGLHKIKLPMASRNTNGGAGAFIENTVKAIYNGAASTFNEGMEGGNMGDMAADGVAEMGNIARRIENGEATVEDAENVVAGAAMTVLRSKIKTVGNKKFNGKADTKSTTSREAFRNAKDQNGIPRSQQPDKTFNTPDKNTGQNLKTYEFTNSKGEKVQIRKDNPRTFPDGGKQGPHFNAGKAGQKLKQHHNFDNNGSK